MSRTATFALAAILLALLLTSCGGESGPAAAQPGSPAYFWAGAKQAYQSGDYTRASENLSKLTQSDNEFRARADAWLMVLSAGIVKGNMEVAEAYDLGAKANKDNPLAFRKQASAARTQAKGVALQFIEAVHYFGDKVKDPNVTFEFAYPTGSLADLPGLQKVAKGMMPQASDAESTAQKAIQKGVVWAACRAVGADDDSAKAMELFKASPVQVPREKFLLGMVAATEQQMALFGPKQLDEPQRLKMLGTEAMEMLKQIPESKASKDLSGKIEKLLKTVKS